MSRGGFPLALGLFVYGAVALAAENEVIKVDDVSVTATREARVTKDVPQAINVIGKEEIEAARMFNIKDALQGTPGVLIDSKNGGYDARLIIRGAGLKAPFGIREIMVIRDGVPMTDPDSFTRLDFIDTQDIERIEVTKGPGNLFSPGSAGGAIQIISRSVFDANANNMRLGAGEEGARNAHLRYGGMVNDSHALAVTFSHREQENHWRDWNEFDTTMLGVKHGVLLGEDATLESELSYSEADLQLPGAVDEALFDEYKRSGEQKETSEPWKHSGRYSRIWFFNSRYERDFGDWSFRPRVYYNAWKHYHPVTGIINESGDWTQTLGTDIENVFRHRLGTIDASLVAGVTVKRTWNEDVRKYQYRDVTRIPFGPQAGRITATLSDKKGAMAETQDQSNLLYGVFMQESLQLGERVLVDAGFRYDRSRLEIDQNELTRFDYTSGEYVAGDGLLVTRKNFKLFSPKLGVSFRLTPAVNLFASVAQADQVPSDSEVTSNPALEPSRTRSYEIGIKGRHADWSFDASAYVSPVEKEIVTVRQPSGESEFRNAGETDKKGVELSGSLRLFDRVHVGGSYAYSDYTFDQFSEPVRTGFVTTNVDRSGNHLPFVPRHQYSVFANYHHPSGFKGRLQANSWGEYWMDNANSEKYDGYDLVTTLMLGYDFGHHSLAFNVENLTNKRYAVEAKKDTSGRVTYTTASPRLMMLTYRYDF
ncbi:MAG: TonB-dependent receptor [Betaproteobacteria bacterium HGW-Betaproteobacteria-1]|jgi:iron complex outermembrane receptor protein|nr:MAG: TonB-dependent receptor [Betaproteobacteria bacterium HGW-Betaproteobacteria-1]